MRGPKHQPMTVHQFATEDCIGNGCLIGDGIYQFDSDGFAFGAVCLCAPSRELCERCAKPWPCDQSAEVSDD